MKRVSQEMKGCEYVNLVLTKSACVDKVYILSQVEYKVCSKQL